MYYNSVLNTVKAQDYCARRFQLKINNIVERYCTIYQWPLDGVMSLIWCESVQTGLNCAIHHVFFKHIIIQWIFIPHLSLSGR